MRKKTWTDADPLVKRHIAIRESINAEMQAEADRLYEGSLSKLVRVVFSKRYKLDSKKQL